MGRVLTQTNAKGAVTSYTYTALSQIQTITDDKGGVTSYTYDALGRVITEKNPLEQTTSYTYDGLGRVLTKTNPLGHLESFTYDDLNRVQTATDKNGNVTTYAYDANGNVLSTTDAKGHTTSYIYDAMNRLIEVHQLRIDTQDGVAGEAQITLYHYDKRGLLKQEIKTTGDSTQYDYDENGNKIQIIDADGFTTNYMYDQRNLVESINYQDGKTARFAYNKNGQLIEAEDQSGAQSFELDLLGRIKTSNDENAKQTSYTYDAVGNKETMTYPDGKVVGYTYDSLNRMTEVVDAQGLTTTYNYDAVGKVTGMNYPNGWKETNAYDAAGQLLTVHDQSPGNATKVLKFQYTYDNNGNVTKEYRRGTGLGQKKEDYTNRYDELNRLIETKGLYGKSLSTYQYDSLGNLTFEQTGNNKMVDYTYNSLNQQVGKLVNNRDQYTNSFDKRGNLISVYYNTKNRVEESYTYDATNRMVKGTNAIGESSEYLYNSLGDLIENKWTVKKNAYGYHDVQMTTVALPGEELTIVQDTPTATTGKVKDIKTPEQVAADTTLNQTSTILKKYVIDYTSPLKNTIMESETNGLNYSYTYGHEKLSVVISPVDTSAGSIVQNASVKLYYHKDRLGSTDYLSDNVQGKVVSYVDYDAWGNPLKKAVLKMGLRELDLVTEYTGHPYDQVINQYYAKARMYDAEDKRFMAEDLLSGSVLSPKSLNPYMYVLDNPLKYVDLDGLRPVEGTVVNSHESVSGLVTPYKLRYTDPHIPPVKPMEYSNTTSTVSNPDGYSDAYFQAIKCKIPISRRGIVVGYEKISIVGNPYDDTVVYYKHAVKNGEHYLIPYYEYQIKGQQTAIIASGVVVVGGYAIYLAGVTYATVSSMGVAQYIQVLTSSPDFQVDKMSFDMAVAGGNKAEIAVEGFFLVTAGATSGGTGNLIGDFDNALNKGSNEVVKGTGQSSKWIDDAGNIKWPNNDGFAGVADDVRLQPGTMIDRYGYEGGSFVSPEGIPYEMRSLAPGTEVKPYHVYEVIKPVDALGGEIAPWFGQQGGGTQYKLNQTIQNLLDGGFIKEVIK